MTNYTNQEKRPTGLMVVWCLVIAGCCFSMSITGIYGAAALPLQTLLSLTSFANPITGLFYLSAAQVIPDPPGIPLSSSQLAISGFLIWHAFNFDGKEYKAAVPFLSAVAPFIVWTTFCSALPGGWGIRTVFVLLYCLLTGYAAVILCRRSGNRVLVCALAFLSAQALAASLFWVLKLKLGTPVEAFDWEIYGSSLREGARIGTSRGNANTLGVPMALGLAGGLLFFLKGMFRKALVRRRYFFAGAVLFLICFPALVASGTRGAMIAFGCGLVFALFNAKIVLRGPAIIGGGGAIAVTVAVFSWFHFDLGKSWGEIQGRAEYYESMNGDSRFAGRDLVWHEAVGAIFDSPLIGGGKPDIESYAGAESMWASHSTFLDAGLMGGIPGFAMYLGFVLYPIYLAICFKKDPNVWLLMSAYITALVTLVSLSGMQYKYWWVLWALFSIWFPKMRGEGRKRNAVRRRRPLNLSVRSTEVDQFSSPSL